MPRTKRKDKSRAVLRTGESQRADGTYQFRWTDSNHKRFCVYAKTLDELHNVEVGEGKKDDRGDEGISDLMQKQGLVRIKRKKSVLGRLYNKKCEVAKKWGRPLPGVKIKRKSD